MIPRFQIFNTQDQNNAGLLSSFSSTGTTSPGTFVKSDGELIIGRLVQPSSSPNTFWQDIDPTGAMIEIAVGAADEPPVSGRFSMSYNGDNTWISSLPYNILAISLTSALNANPAIAADGGVSVVLQGNTYIVTFLTVGSKGALTLDGSLLNPTSTISKAVVVPGSPTANEVVVFELSQSPAAYSNSWTPLPVAASTISQIQAGSAAANNIQRLTLSPQPYGGTFTIFNSLISGGSATVPFNVSADGLQAALGANFGVASNAPFVFDLTTIPQAGGTFPAFTVDLTGLQVPVGFQMILQLNTYSMLLQFANTKADTLQLTYEGKITFQGQSPQTFYQGTLNINRSVINLGTILPAQYPIYPAPGALMQVGYFFEQSLGDGVDSVVLDYSALALTATPSQIVVTSVGKYASGEANIYGSAIDSSLTTNHATAELNAPTDNGLRKIHFYVIP